MCLQLSELCWVLKSRKHVAAFKMMMHQFRDETPTAVEILLVIVK